MNFKEYCLILRNAADYPSVPLENGFSKMSMADRAELP